MLGFSQGAAAAVAVAARPVRFPGLKFVILAGAPDLPPPDAWDSDFLQLPTGMPSLHIISPQDTTVPMAQSVAVAAAVFGENARTYSHGKGHALPCRVADIDAYVDFIQDHLTPVHAPTSLEKRSARTEAVTRPPSRSSHPSNCVCSQTASPSVEAAAVLAIQPARDPPGLRKLPGQAHCSSSTVMSITAAPPSAGKMSTAASSPPATLPAAPPPPTAPQFAPLPPAPPSPPLTLEEVEAWADELAALEAIYGEDLHIEEGSAPAAG